MTTARVLVRPGVCWVEAMTHLKCICICYFAGEAELWSYRETKAAGAATHTPKVSVHAIDPGGRDCPACPAAAPVSTLQSLATSIDYCGLVFSADCFGVPFKDTFRRV